MSQFNYQENQTLTITYENKPKLVRLVEVLSNHDNHIMVKDNGKIKKFLKNRILTVAPRINFEKVYESISDEDAVKAVDEVERTPQNTNLKFTSYPTSFIGVIRRTTDTQRVLRSSCKRQIPSIATPQCKRRSETVATSCKRKLFQ
jgi:hypothetical protein